MHGVVRFDSLAEALRHGYQVYDRDSDGYRVRRLMNGLWEMALVKIRR